MTDQQYVFSLHEYSEHVISLPRMVTESVLSYMKMIESMYNRKWCTQVVFYPPHFQRGNTHC